jgi:hypothetical protein
MDLLIAADLAMNLAQTGIAASSLLTIVADTNVLIEAAK